MEEKGTKKDQGKPPLKFLTKAFLFGVASAHMFGAKKYGDWNFRKGLEYTRLTDSAMRHLIAFLDGEDLDPESGLPHVHLAGANINMLCDMIENKPELDDRYKK
jgi:hypothetical protein